MEQPGEGELTHAPLWGPMPPALPGGSLQKVGRGRERRAPRTVSRPAAAGSAPADALPVRAPEAGGSSHQPDPADPG